jgi:hypothetical protein
MLESLRQLGLAVAIVLVLGLVALRVFSHQASTVAEAPPSTAPAAQKRAWTPPPAAKLDVVFDPSAPAGKAAPLNFAIADAPQGSTILISGLEPGATLSQGENRGADWRLGVAELANLAVIPPKDFVGDMNLVIELRLPDGALGARQLIKLDWTGAAAEAQKTSAQASAPAEAPLAATVTPPAPKAENLAEKQLANAATPPQAEAPAGAPVAPPAEASEARVAPCFAKLDGKVVMQGQCRIAWAGEKSVTFELGDKRISITQLHDRVWRLKWNGKDKGKIFRREGCWGAEKAWVCEHAI